MLVLYCNIAIFADIANKSALIMKMNVLRITLTLFLLSCFAIQAQNKTILFTVDDEPVYTSEFKRVYSKNLDLV
ncbi:MAG: peptidylprolyl isomerase, partial [Olleya sp.]